MRSHRTSTHSSWSLPCEHACGPMREAHSCENPGVQAANVSVRSVCLSEVPQTQSMVLTTPRASRNPFRRLSDHVSTASSKACWAALEAASVALAYCSPTFEVAAPYLAEAEAARVSLRNSARCLRMRARSWFSLVPCGTLIPFLSQKSLSCDSPQASMSLSVRVA